jgi:hypothetical protein
MSLRTKALVAILIAVLLIVGFSAAIAAGFELSTQQALANATQYVGVVHTGEQIVLSCPGDPIFVELYGTTPDKVYVLAGGISTKITLWTINVSPKTAVFSQGCLKVKIVKDPQANYMLEIYAPPAK